MRRTINHPAFPVHPYAGDLHNPPIRGNTGMGIRDFFMQGTIAGLCQSLDSWAVTSEDAETLVKSAALIVDAVMQEREK
jgi:hypothetical protein